MAYTTIEMLVWRLQQIKNNVIEVQRFQDPDSLYRRQLVHDEVAECLANEYLIDPHANVDWENVKVLEAAGFHVLPLERDSFGWLVGGISTDNGVVTFG